jgi:hypothetical protein
MSLNNLAYATAVILAILMVTAFVMALRGEAISLPPDWLINWTDWLLSAVGVIFAPIVLVTTTKALRKWAGV